MSLFNSNDGFKIKKLETSLAERATSVTNFANLKVAVAGGYDWQPAIQAALNSFNGKKGYVFLPDGSYDIYNKITIPLGVGIKGKGKINRKFSRSVSGWAFFLKGDNVIEDISYDGGSQSITVDVPGQEFIYYADFTCDTATDSIWFNRCKFYNSCGSFILSSKGNLLVTNNYFGEYLDHSVYVGSRNYTPPTITNSVVVTGNIFESSSTTREAIKGRNGLSGYVISNNVLKMDNAWFVTIDIGDNVVSSNIDANITISGNAGTCQTFFSTATASDTETMQDNVLTITGNSITCSKYVLWIGAFPSATSQFGASFKDITISGNTFKTPNAFGIINGNINSSLENISFINNTVDFDGTTFLFVYGNVLNMKLSGNNLKCNRGSGSGGFWINTMDNYNRSPYYPTKTGILKISDNIFNGNLESIIYEDSTASTLSKSIFQFYLDINGNTVINNGGNIIPVQVKGTYVNTITTTCTIKNTTIFSNTTSPNTFKLGSFKDDSIVPALRYTMGSGAQTLPATTATLLAFGAKDFDLTNSFVTSPSYQFTAPQAGIYQITVSTELSNAGTGTNYFIDVYKNGVSSQRLFTTTIGSAVTATSQFQPNGTCIMNLAVNDTIQIYAFAGGSVTISANAPRSYMEICKI